jgi:hypothetical protein
MKYIYSLIYLQDLIDLEANSTSKKVLKVIGISSAIEQAQGADFELFEYDFKP